MLKDNLQDLHCPAMSELWQTEHQYGTYRQVADLTYDMLLNLGELPPEVLQNLVSEEPAQPPSLFSPPLQQFRIHPGLSNADLWDTTLSILMVRSAGLLLDDLKQLGDILKAKAFQYKLAFMVSRIHGHHAQPTTFGLKMANWYKSVERCIERMKRAKSVIGYGIMAGSVGSFAHFNPHIEENVCRKLGLKPDAAANQLIQRDRHAEYLSILALVASTIGQFTAEIYLLQRTDVREVKEAIEASAEDTLFTRHPLIVEQLRDLANVIMNHAFSLMADISLWGERDFSNTGIRNVTIAESCILLDYMLQRFVRMMENLIVNPERMRQNIERSRGLIYLEDILGLLIRKGLPVRQASELLSPHVTASQERQENLLALLMKDKNFLQYVDQDELGKLTSLEEQLKQIDFIFNRVFTNE